MKAFSRILISAFLALSLLSTYVFAAGTGEAVYTHTVALTDGFQYTNGFPQRRRRPAWTATTLPFRRQQSPPIVIAAIPSMGV
jgi:hypothetical protein